MLKTVTPRFLIIILVPTFLRLIQYRWTFVAGTLTRFCKYLHLEIKMKENRKKKLQTVFSKQGSTPKINCILILREVMNYFPENYFSQTKWKNK